MTKLLLLRHAESEWNARNLWQGQADPPLSELGLAQAAAAASRLNGDVTRVVSSDLQRASQTADAIADVLGLDVVLDRRLREVNVGDWTGLTGEEIDERWPGLRSEWRAGRLDAIPGGEPRVDLLARIVSALRDGALVGAGPTLVVTHATAIGVVERQADAHPGQVVPQLCCRWFEVGEEITAIGERLSLMADQPS